MINDTSGNKLSRSASQTDQSDQSSSSVCLRNQSSCSSLTSGIGQSDQSICNERSVPDQQLAHSRNLFQKIPLYSESKASTSQYDSESNNSDPNFSQRIPASRSDTDSNLTVTADARLELDIKKFVDIIFTDSQAISLEKKAEFGKFMQRHEARLMFAMSVDDYRVNSKRVNELTFYSLAQYFSIVLLECLLAEDFRPAKIIMNMMFTYYYEQNFDRIPPRDRPQFVTTGPQASKNSAINEDDREANDQPKVVRTYLYTLLKEQEIFKSIRFWTSAFYESVIIERSNHPVFVDKQRGQSNEKRDEEMDCSKNITFGLLGSFIHNMCLLELSHEFCQQFLDKHSTIAGLSDDQLDMLRSNLKSMFNEATAGDRTPISQATASERLSKFLQKLSHKLNQSTSNATNH